MLHRLRMFVVFPLAVMCLTVFCRCGEIQAASTEKKSTPVAPVSPRLPAPVNVNVTVNVRVSHDTKVDVRIEAPCAPVIGSLQLPDFVQQFLGSFFKTPTKPAPNGSSSRSPSP